MVSSGDFSASALLLSGQSSTAAHLSFSFAESGKSSRILFMF